MCGRDLCDKLVSENLAYVIILHPYYTNLIVAYLFDYLTFLDEPLLDSGLLGSFSEIWKVNADNLSEEPHHHLCKDKLHYLSNYHGVHEIVCGCLI